MSHTHEDSDSPVTCSDSGSISSQVFSPSAAPPSTHVAPPTTYVSPSHSVEHDLFLPDSERDPYALAGQDDSISPQPFEKFRNISISREQMLPLPHELPRRPASCVTNFSPSSLGGSGAHFPTDFPLPPRMLDDPLPLPDEVPPTGVTSERKESSVSQTSKGHEALSAAVSDLMKRCIFVGVVTKEHCWPNSNSGSSTEFSVKVSQPLCSN